MRILKTVFFAGLFLLGMNSCTPKQPTQNTEKMDTNTNCGVLERLQFGAFQELTTDTYTLSSARQENDKLVVEVESEGGLASADLYWTGKTMYSLPPQTTVKLVVKANENPSPEKQTQQFCFDLSDMKFEGEVKIYVLDDEEVVHFNFKK